VVWGEQYQFAVPQPNPYNYAFHHDLYGLEVPDTGNFGGGAIVVLGGGCGPGGMLSAVGPAAVGNGTFAINLSGADPAALLALVAVGESGPGIGCGPCELTVPSYGTLTSAVTAGGLSVSIPLPASSSWIGTDIVWQTVVLPSVGPCPLLTDFAISNRLQTTIGW
jgi:hypothetical protein